MTDIHDDEIVKLSDIPPDDDAFDPCEEGENLEELTGVFGFGITSRHVLATWLPAAIKKWGGRVKLVEGWESRGRPLSAGAFDPNGSLTHHTGSTSSASKPNPSLSTLINGRTDLKGPLCQVATDYNGLIYIIAAGRANHAGSSRAAMGNPAGDGNAMYVGNEVMTNGTQKMPDAQYRATVIVAAAIADHFGQRTAAKAGLHNTTSTSGKWDLGAGIGKAGVPYSITKFRADVDALLKAGPPGLALPLEVGDKGALVGTVQTLLNKTGAKLTVDNSYGPATEAAVKVFQTAKRLPVTGIVNTATMTALKAATTTTTPTPSVGGQESDDVFVFQITDHPDPKVAAARVVSNGFQARVLNHLGFVRLNGAHKYQTGKDLFVVGVKDFSGIAHEWVGPPIIQSDGQPFPLPADIKAVTQ